MNGVVAVVATTPFTPSSAMTPICRTNDYQHHRYLECILVFGGKVLSPLSPLSPLSALVAKTTLCHTHDYQQHH
jgi:hypothetical protein